MFTSRMNNNIHTTWSQEKENLQNHLTRDLVFDENGLMK